MHFEIGGFRSYDDLLKFGVFSDPGEEVSGCRSEAQWLTIADHPNFASQGKDVASLIMVNDSVCLGKNAADNELLFELRLTMSGGTKKSIGLVYYALL